MGSNTSTIQYSLPLQGTKQPGFSNIYRNPRAIHKLAQRPQQDINTMKDVLELSCLIKFSEKNCLGKIIQPKSKNNDPNQSESRTVQYLSYKETYHVSQKLGSAILKRQLFSFADDTTFTDGKPMKFVGIFSKNRRQWLLVDIACLLYGLTSVPLYETLGKQNLSFCLNHTKLTTCFCNAQTAQIILSLEDSGALKTLILFDIPKYDILAQLQKKYKLHTFQELIDLGQKFFIDCKSIKVQATQCATFSYTSGTTGPPKAVMISHANLTAVTCASIAGEDSPDNINSDDVYMSFLPLPHSFQRSVVMTLLAKGCSIAFYSGDVLKLRDDAVVVKPTIFAGVPRIYNKIYQAVQPKISEAQGYKKTLIENGIEAKRNKIRQNGDPTHWLYDPLLFSKTKQVLGGRIRLMVTGGAPLRKQVHQFIKIIMCAPFFQGYGQTQNIAGAFATKTRDTTYGHVGGVVDTLEFRLADIPEMNYLSTDKNENGQPTPRGQIWLRGAQIFMGYYKDLQKTKEAKTNDGWLRTGDVGMIIPHTNALKIIDRKKNIFKLQQGQYVAAQKIERCYFQCPLVSQIFLTGDSTQDYVVGIVVPHKQNLAKFARDNGIIVKDIEEQYQNLQLRTLVCKNLNYYGQREGLKGFQQAKNIILENKSFLDRGILTNTMKVKRFEAKKHYQNQINQMYAQGQLKIKS